MRKRAAASDCWCARPNKIRRNQSVEREGTKKEDLISSRNQVFSLIDPALLGCNGEKQSQKQPQVLQLRLAQRTRQTPLRMTSLWCCNPLGPDQ
jgi:hypothetical protein